MKKIILKQGEKIWNFIFIKEVDPDISPSRKHRKVLVKCICWIEKKIRLNSILTGLQQTCGCIKNEVSSRNWKNNKTHWLSYNKFYKTFNWINQRVKNKNSKDYKNYWLRGIKILWETFEDFKKDMYESYLIHIEKYGENNTTIERIDNNKHYCKENCKWATKYEQSLNKRGRIIVNWKTLQEISAETKKPYWKVWREYKKFI